MNEEKWQELISPDMVEYSMRMKNIIFKKHSNEIWYQEEDFF
jgi:hypothetical protein